MHDFIPYGKQWIDEDDVNAVVQVLNGDLITQGPKIEEFENAICEYTGAKYCVAVSNGTAALHIAVAALKIEKGKEGITSPNSFVATSNCLIYNNLIPIFADIDPLTYNVDPDSILNKITGDTKIIIPVHFAGQPVDIEQIHYIAKSNNCYLIEDAAHAIGSKYSDGSKVGNCKYSDMTIFSFHPVKTITTGEGGAVTTNNKELYERLMQLRTHGITKNSEKLLQNPGPWYYEMQEVGFNYRMTDIQAVLGINQLKKLDRFVTRRKEIVCKYNESFKDEEWITIPYEKDKLKSAFHLYVLLIDFNKIDKTRGQVMDELKNKQVGTQVHYIPIYSQPYYRKNYVYNTDEFCNMEKYYNSCLSIPLYPLMSDSDVQYVVDSIKKIK